MSALFALILAASGGTDVPPQPVLDDSIIVTGTRVFPGRRVPDAELAAMRGGFRLPNGIDVAMVVQSETSLDGALLLRSVYRIDTGTPQLSVFAPRPGERVETQRPDTGAAGSGGDTMQVMFDRTSGGIVFAPRGVGGGAVNVNAGGAAASTAGADGLPALDLGNGPVDTAGGTLRLVGGPGGQSAILNGAEIDVRHVFGQGYGTIIANSGSDRMIDTVTTISLDLAGATPQNLGSAMLRIDALAADVTRGMIR